MIELALDCLSFFLFSTELGMAMAMAMVAMAPVDRERDELCRQMNCFWSADVSTGNGIFSVFTVQHNLYIFFSQYPPPLISSSKYDGSDEVYFTKLLAR